MRTPKNKISLRLASASIPAESNLLVSKKNKPVIRNCPRRSWPIGLFQTETLIVRLNRINGFTRNDWPTGPLGLIALRQLWRFPSRTSSTWGDGDRACGFLRPTSQLTGRHISGCRSDFTTPADETSHISHRRDCRAADGDVDPRRRPRFEPCFKKLLNSNRFIHLFHICHVAAGETYLVSALNTGSSALN